MYIILFPPLLEGIHVSRAEQSLMQDPTGGTNAKGGPSDKTILHKCVRAQSHPTL